MALAIIGFIFLVVILLLVFLDIEGLRRKEEELERETKEMEIRLRDCERAVDWTHRNSGGRQ